VLETPFAGRHAAVAGALVFSVPPIVGPCPYSCPAGQPGTSFPSFFVSERGTVAVWGHGPWAQAE
jgi:hypothetical protein